MKITSAVLRMSRVKDPRQFGSECSHSHAALGASGLAGLSEIEMHRPLLWRHHGCLCRLARCSSMSVMADEPPKVSILNPPMACECDRAVRLAHKHRPQRRSDHAPCAERGRWLTSCARLEHKTDVSGVTQHQLDAARAEVVRAIGWSSTELRCSPQRLSEPTPMIAGQHHLGQPTYQPDSRRVPQSAV